MKHWTDVVLEGADSLDEMKPRITPPRPFSDEPRHTSKQAALVQMFDEMESAFGYAMSAAISLKVSMAGSNDFDIDQERRAIAKVVSHAVQSRRLLEAIAKRTGIKIMGRQRNPMLQGIPQIK